MIQRAVQGYSVFIMHVTYVSPGLDVHASESTRHAVLLVNMTQPATIFSFSNHNISNRAVVHMPLCILAMCSGG